ncbi:MAG: hypothetical protein MJ095_03595 [Oscillospiraceae bacterium]|nr:hypothetical protein [Oscillospiraceae bacterium]
MLLLKLKRLTEILDYDTEQNEGEFTELESFDGDIEIKNVTFRYGNRKPVLNNISIRAAGRKAVEAEIEKYLKRYCTLTMASWICGWIPSEMTLFSYILDPGGSIAGWLDSRNGKPNNGYVDV